MAIADIAAYTHLSQADIEALGNELDAIRRDIEESLGEKDAAYIRRTIKFQRMLEVVARLLIACSRSRAGWVSGPRRWLTRKVSRTWRSVTTSATANGIG